MHTVFLGYSVRKLRQLQERIDDCLTRLDDGRIWWREAETQNAVGNLVLHICGNLGQWILWGVGGAPDTRQRDQEFAARGDVTRDELRRRLKERVEEAVRVIEGVTPERLMETFEAQSYQVTVLEAIYHVVEHFSQHTGQVVYATKLLTREDLGYYRHLHSPTHPEQTP